jgi:hypothetical protein
MTGELIVIPGGWPAVTDVAALFGSTSDDLYEEQLKACKRIGHDLALGIADDRETLHCLSCDAHFVEVDP